MRADMPFRPKRVAAYIAAGLLAFGVGLLPSLRFAHAATPRTILAKVERVSDGDTSMAISSNRTKLRIRLLGIDAPEVAHGTKPGHPYGGAFLF